MLKLPKYFARRALEHALAWIDRHPAHSGWVQWTMVYVPTGLKERMLNFRRSRAPQANIELPLEPDPAVLSEWEALVSKADLK